MLSPVYAGESILLCEEGAIEREAVVHRASCSVDLNACFKDFAPLLMEHG